MNDKDMLINLFKEKNVVKFGNFTLSSGKKSNYYINVKGAITYPKILKILTNIIVKKIKDLDIQKIAGPAVGAIPIITAVSLKANIPFVIIRKKKKKYGTSKLVEGDLSKNDKVVVIEDVTTTGNSLLRSIRIIEDAGAKVERAIVVVDRGEGAIEKFKKEGIKLDVILTADELMD
nr:orotate phosphoribosyltransferase [Methanothermus fervidus]